MSERPKTAVRVQVYLTDPRLVAALEAEAEGASLSLSQAAGKAIARGLAQEQTDARLFRLERLLRDHMRVMQRDMQIVQELEVEVARAFFLRLPDAHIDEDPIVLAALEARIERMLDRVAHRLVSGGVSFKDPEP